VNIPNKEAGGECVEQHFAGSVTRGEAPDQRVCSEGQGAKADTVHYSQVQHQQQYGWIHFRDVSRTEQNTSPPVTA